MEPAYPKGTPEYEEYRKKLKEELRKWVAHEPPYDTDESRRAHAESQDQSP